MGKRKKQKTVGMNTPISVTISAKDAKFGLKLTVDLMHGNIV